ncbi:hypothetical protein LCGC14_2048960 [marine sediment metagenome]|uniref:Uncharacterized protein n=1 Tax=marine sediment metagenome TaxID=412755 RepID=A0A0F9EPQ5_9ZZZZ
MNAVYAILSIAIATWISSCAAADIPPPNPCAKVTVIIEGTIVEPVESGVSSLQTDIPVIIGPMVPGIITLDLLGEN